MPPIDAELFNQLARANRAQDEARALAITEIRRLERGLGEALQGRTLHAAPNLHGEGGAEFRGWRVRAVPAQPLGSGEHLVLVPHGLLVMAQTGIGHVLTRVAEDTDLVLEDLEALLEVMTVALGQTAAGRRGERADRVRGLARRCMRLLTPESRADHFMDTLEETLIQGEARVGSGGAALRELILEAIQGARS